MQTVKNFLGFNISRVNTIADIAEKMNVSPETLRKAFLREEKMPLSEFISRMRVEVMKEYLRIGDEPCQNICFNAGLREDSGARLFKKITGMTMKQYRDAHSAESVPNETPSEPKVIKKKKKTAGRKR